MNGKALPPISCDKMYHSFVVTKEPSKSNKAYATKKYLDTVIINKAVPIEFKGYEIPKERQFMICVRSQTKMTRLGMLLTPKGEDYFKYRNKEVCKYYTIKKYEDIFTVLEDVKKFIAEDGGVLEKNVPVILKAIEYNIYLKLNKNRIYDKEKKDAESLKNLKDNVEHTANFNLPSVNWAKKPAFKIGYEHFSYLLYSTDDIEGAIKYFKEKLPKIGYSQSEVKQMEEKLRSKGFYGLVKERQEWNEEELDAIKFLLSGKSKRMKETLPNFEFGFEELGYFDKVHTVEDFDKVEKGELMY